MKQETQKRIEEAIKAEIQPDIADDNVDLLNVSDEEFDCFMLYHARFKQTSLLKLIASDYAKKGAKFALANIGASSLLGLTLAATNPLHPVHSATWALLTTIPSVIYCVPKFDFARKIGKLARASQDYRQNLAEKYLVDEEEAPIFKLCEQVIDGINPLEDLFAQKQALDKQSADGKIAEITPEEANNLHCDIMEEYMAYSDYCDAACDYYLSHF